MGKTQEKFSSVVSFLCPGRVAPITLTDVVLISPLIVRAKIPNLKMLDKNYCQEAVIYLVAIFQASIFQET